MKKFLFTIIFLLCCLTFSSAAAWEKTFIRPTSAGPFPVTIQNLGDGTTHYTIAPDGNNDNACLDLLFDTRLWGTGITVQEGTMGPDSWIKITISVPIPFSGKYLCCDLEGNTVNQKLATCGGTQSCCGDPGEACCAAVTITKCYIREHSDCS